MPPNLSRGRLRRLRRHRCMMSLQRQTYPIYALYVRWWEHRLGETFWFVAALSLSIYCVVAYHRAYRDIEPPKREGAASVIN